VTHSEDCFISRLEKGMRIWDKKNPEPSENLEEEAWESWYRKRASMVTRGIKKITEDLGIQYSENMQWIVPCTCERKKAGPKPRCSNQFNFPT
jgi:hypothetical protein